MRYLLKEAAEKKGAERWRWLGGRTDSVAKALQSFFINSKIQVKIITKVKLFRRYIYGNRLWIPSS